jgi:hypothetical protein
MGSLILEERAPAVSRRRRRHRPDCRHCDMVDQYRWARAAAIRAREVAAGDEDLFVPVFKWWLINCQESEQDPEGVWS